MKHTQMTPMRRLRGTGLKRAQNLGPDGDHAEKKADGREGCGFFDNGAKHEVLPERTENIIHGLF